MRGLNHRYSPHRIAERVLLAAGELTGLLTNGEELRLILAGHDITMQAGEVAEFDTALPHWFGAAGDRPVEILSILSREGERIHVRAAPRRTSSDA